MIVIIGYGVMYLINIYIYILVVIEVFIGLIGIVMIIGLMFVWFLLLIV